MTEDEKNEFFEMIIKTKTAKKLYDMLYEIWQNDDFALGVIFKLEDDTKKLKMIELLENGLNDTDEIILHAMAIERNIEVEEVKEMIASIDFSKRQVFYRK